MSRDQRFIAKMLSGLSIAVACCGAAFARDIHVCNTCAHKSIQSAVNDAASGNTVLVAQGTYVENVTVAGKALHVVGGPGTTSVIAAGPGPVFTLGTPSVEGTPYLLDISNLTISGGNHLSGTGEGGGIQVRAGAYLHLSNSVVSGNVAASGAGISMRTVPGTNFANQIDHCHIQNNTATASTGGSAIGGGLALLAGDAQIEQSLVALNQAKDGAGVYEAATAHSLFLSDVTISQNYANAASTTSSGAAGRGGGLFVAAFIRMLSTEVVGNRAFGTDATGGLYLIPVLAPSDIFITPSGPHIENSVFSENLSSRGTTAGITITGDPSVPVFMFDVAVVLNSGYGIFNNGSIIEQNLLVQLNALANCAGSGSGCPQ